MKQYELENTEEKADNKKFIEMPNKQFKVISVLARKESDGKTIKQIRMSISDNLVLTYKPLISVNVTGKDSSGIDTEYTITKRPSLIELDTKILKIATIIKEKGYCNIETSYNILRMPDTMGVIKEYLYLNNKDLNTLVINE